MPLTDGSQKTSSDDSLVTGRKTIRCCHDGARHHIVLSRLDISDQTILSQFVDCSLMLTWQLVDSNHVILL